MSNPAEFWQRLHGLAEEYDALGLTTEERALAVINHFRGLSPTIRRQLLVDLFRLANELPDIYPLAGAAELEADAVNRRSHRKGDVA